MAVVRLSPFGPKRQFIGTDGLPLSGYWLFFFVGGSVNNKAVTYTTPAGDVANPNPIQLNALGEVPNEVYFVSGQAYKAFLEPPDPSNPSVPIDPPTSGQTLGDFLQGINDVTATIDQWIAGPGPTFINATQFTLIGDQTSTFQVGRRLKFTIAAGTVYGQITVSAFTTLTTVTVVLDSGVLDAGLSAVFYGIVSATNTSQPAIINAGANIAVTYNANGQPVITNTMPAQAVPVSRTRQTVISGPIDVNGQPAFGGATGGTTVTMAGTLIASLANGFSATGGDVNAYASGTNLSWTGLNANGTWGLFADNISGVLTPVNGCLPLPVYTDSNAAPSTTNGQATFNTTQYVMNLGNGATAPQTNRICMGQVTISGGVVSNITWYALNRKYKSPATAVQSTGTLLAFNHNLGVYPDKTTFRLRNITAELGYSIGEEANPMTSTSESANGLQRIGTLAMYTFGLNTNSYDVPNLSTFSTSMSSITRANWNQILTASTDW